MRTSGENRKSKYSLHIGTLASLSVAQPVFDLLSRQPEYLVARQSGLLNAWLLIFLLNLAVPGLVVAGSFLLGWAVCATRWFQGAGIGMFVFLLGLLALKTLKQDPGIVLIGTVGLLAGLILVVYDRSRTAHWYLTFLSPAILVVPADFLGDPSVRRVLNPDTPQGAELDSGEPDTPIVMVVFDKLPLSSLLDRWDGIDSLRFPNFAGLGDQGTWFRNATTVSPSTQYAVSAMLTGNLPPLDRTLLPALADYPDNLFTWLRNSHWLNVSESTTYLSPAGQGSKSFRRQSLRQLLLDVSVIYLHLILPENLTYRLPDIRYGCTWSLGHPVRQFDAFLQSIPEQREPGLHFIHIQVPHLP